MSMRSFEQAIQLYQSGQLEEAGRLLQLVTKDEEIPANVRASAYVWLAETKQDASGKVACYQEALALEPTNQDASQRLQYWMAQQFPAPPPNVATPPPQQQTGYQTPQQQTGYQTPQQQTGYQTPQQQTGYQTPQQQTGYQTPQQSESPSPPMELTGDQRSVALLHTPNGNATGFFLTQDGLIATTRHAVHGEVEVAIGLLDGREVRGRVVRSFPEYDIAFVKLNARVQHILPLSMGQTLAQNASLAVLGHKQAPVKAQRRATEHRSAPMWFPTTLLRGSLAGAGGEIVLEVGERSAVAGLLTRNYSRSTGFLYGVHISAIRQCYAIYQEETQFPSGSELYCNECGHISRAPAFGGAYCETCGATLHTMRGEDILRDPAMLQRYDDDSHLACPHCQARVGIHHGECLRCGREVDIDGA